MNAGATIVGLGSLNRTAFGRQLVAFIFVMIVSSARTMAEPDHFLCVVEHATGLHYYKETQDWLPQTFRADGKYIVRKLTDDDRKKWPFLRKDTTWAFFDFRSNVPLVTCTEGKYSRMECGSMATLDKDSMRFQVFYGGGYLDQGMLDQLRRSDPQQYQNLSRYVPFDTDHPDDMIIEIGTCSSF